MIETLRMNWNLLRLMREQKKMKRVRVGLFLQ
jgi:hypothetical protein